MTATVPPRPGPMAPAENADVETASAGYARRFEGPVGAYFLEAQARATLALLAPWPRARVLDVGGGHGQLARPLVEAGYEVTVLGSGAAADRGVCDLVEAGRVRFLAADLLATGLPARSFDVVLSFRLLPHVARWGALVGELCRLASRAVVVDYPTRRSVNALAEPFFALKQGVEGNARPFLVFRERELAGAFAERGFDLTGRRPQFFFPMALHRGLGRAGLTRGLERGAAALGLTRALGSPVIARFEPTAGTDAGRDPLPPRGEGQGGGTTADEPWALALFRRSLLKQRKYAEIDAALGPTDGLRCLDLGSDNGVVSLLLRRRGGSWASADLTAEAVASIRELVESDVHLLESERLPFPDASFDRVVVVDMLEHVVDEVAFADELGRVTRPGGRLVVNTPYLKPTLLRRFRHALGQTDAKHGHLRPGYTPARLAELLGERFALESRRTYSRFFSELVDTLINWGVERLGKKSSSKGLVVTGADVARHRKLFRAYSALYPIVWLITRLDALVPASGYMLIAAARREPGPGKRRASGPGPE